MKFVFPKTALLEQRVSASPAVDLCAALCSVPGNLRPRARVAVAVGSRGITGLLSIVRTVVRKLQQAGTHPFIVPAMGSHGGATPEGQQAVLARYGITEEKLGVPIEPSLETIRIGETLSGVPVHFSSAAFKSDAIVVVNRVKPHTDFSGRIGSGIIKMLAIGLGKHLGATTCHAAARHDEFENVLRKVAAVILSTAPVHCGVAIIEGADHQIAKVEVIPPAEIFSREEALLEEARKLMPKLPFSQVDLLIVDQIGKNISGAGMDPNIVGRSVHGYCSLLSEPAMVRRIFVRDLSPDSMGNAIGLGLADFTTSRLVNAMDRHVTTTNALTSLTVQSAKIPIHYDTDREAIGHALQSLGDDPLTARVVRIRDTLSLARCEISSALSPEIPGNAELSLISPFESMRFDSQGNLPALAPMEGPEN